MEQIRAIILNDGQAAHVVFAEWPTGERRNFCFVLVDVEAAENLDGREFGEFKFCLARR